MADIKTKDNAKGTIRTIDKAAVATQRMKQAYIATKEKAERSVNANSSSAEEYASDKLESGIDEVVHDGAYAFDKAGRKGLETTKENIRTAKDGIQRFKQQRAEQLLRKQASQNTSSAIKTVDKAEKTIKQLMKWRLCMALIKSRKIILPSYCRTKTISYGHRCFTVSDTATTKS